MLDVNSGWYQGIKEMGENDSKSSLVKESSDKDSRLEHVIAGLWKVGMRIEMGSGMGMYYNPRRVQRTDGLGPHLLPKLQ